MGVANCKRCSAVFHQHSSYPFCPGCALTLEDARTVLYQLLQNPRYKEGLLLREAAEQTGVSPDDIERLIFHGQLGTGVRQLMTECKTCGNSMRFIDQNNGKTCQRCTKEMADKGGVSIHTVNELAYSRGAGHRTAGVGMKYKKGQSSQEYVISAGILFTIMLTAWQALNPAVTISNYLQGMLNASGGNQMVVQPLGRT